MKKLVLAVALIGTLASCTPEEQGTAIGAGSGAIIGGAVTHSWGGAAVGRSQRQGYCVYRDRYGRRYEARCN
jgi:hypothetical protein